MAKKRKSSSRRRTTMQVGQCKRIKGNRWGCMTKKGFRFQKGKPPTGKRVGQVFTRRSR